METMKRSWVSPVKEVQVFVPQEYCVVCHDDTHGVDYSAHCCPYSERGYVFWDKNSNGQIDYSEREADWGSSYSGSSQGAHGGCDRTHTWESGSVPQYNAIVLVDSQDSSSDWNGHSLAALTREGDYIIPDGTKFRRAFVMAPDKTSRNWLVCYDLSAIEKNHS